MFNLIPWKKRNHGDSISVRHAEPSRQEFGHSLLGPLRDEFDALVERFFDNPWFGRTEMRLPGMRDLARFASSLDLGWEDKEEEFVCRVELPGYEPGDLDVRVGGSTLTICAEHKDEKQEKGGASSYRYGSFTRTLTLPNGVDASKIDARYHSGVLEVHLPKTEQARGKRIPVNVN